MSSRGGRFFAPGGEFIGAGGELTAAEEAFVQSANSGIILLAETTAPSATSGIGKLYVKSSDSKLYYKNDSGTETEVGGGGSGASTALDNLASVAINTTLVSDTDNTDALGTSAIAWSDLFLGNGAIITFNSAPSTADVTITHSANMLTIAGGDLTLPAAGLIVGASTPFSDAAGTLTLQNVDALDATTEATIEAAIDTLANLTSIQGRTVTLADAGANAIFGWDDTAGAYENLTQAEASVIIDHDQTTNFVADEHVAHSGVTLTAGNGLTGGGTIAANRTFAVGAGTGITVNSDDVAVDQSTAFAWTGAHTHTVAGLVLTLTNSADAASSQVAIFQGDRATMADADEAYISLRLSDDAGTQKEVARLTWVATDVNAATSVDGRIDFAVMTAGTLADEMQLDGAALSPSTNDGLALGTTSLGWADLHLATGGVINWANGEVTITETDANTLTIAGATAVSLGTSAALTVGSIEVGHASDTTITRVSAGVIAIEGVNVLTVAGGTLTGSITLGENTSIALDPAGSADGKYTGITVTGTAGAALAFGDLIYLDPTDSRWELADANAAAAADGDARGILGICVQAAAGDGNATTILLNGIVRADAAFPALTIGAPVYVSETAGDIVVTQPTTTDVVIRIVGVAITADEIYFNPDFTWVTHT